MPTVLGTSLKLVNLNEKEAETSLRHPEWRRWRGLCSGWEPFLWVQRGLSQLHIESFPTCLGYSIVCIICPCIFKRRKLTHQMEELRFDSFDWKPPAFPTASHCPKAARASLGPWFLSHNPSQTGCYLFIARKLLVSLPPSHFHKGKFSWPSADCLFLVSP